MSELNSFAHKLGNGKIVPINSKENIFILESYPGNPIVKPQELNLTWEEEDGFHTGAVFNGGAEIYNKRIILAPRCQSHYKKVIYIDKKLGIERAYLDNYTPEVWLLESKDGINFTKVKNKVLKGDGTSHDDFKYGIEDVRIVKYGKKYLLVGCGKIKPPFKGDNADRIAIHSTEDFENIIYHGIIDSFDSRNAVPFPEPLSNGDYYMFLRFEPNIHLVKLEAGIEQLLQPAKHKKLWEKIYKDKKNNIFISSGNFPHEREKVGSSTQPIKTDRGWLVLYHSVGEIKSDILEAYGVTEEIKRGYSVCATLLDLEDPRKVISRTTTPLYIPNAPYELYGNGEYPVDVPAVVFPVGNFIIGDKLVIYAGAGDKYTVLLSCNLNSLLDYLLGQCKL